MIVLPYRSLSFHQSYPDPRLIDLGAKLGFNDICFQSEGGLLGPLRALRFRADRSGYFDRIRKNKMTISLWIHEFADYDKSWGEPSAGNETLWTAINARYDYILTELLPEVDYLVLTVVETQIRATEPAILQRLVREINECCHRHGKKLIARSFVHHPSELSEVTEAICGFPDDVSIMTKDVPQDWHMRSIDDPLIGKVGGRTQFIETDIAGEYFRMDHVANCFADTLGARFKRWIAAGVSGISVRVDRGWAPWERQNIVCGQAQEANLWTLGMLAAGTASTVDDALKAYAKETFGPQAAATMVEVLRPTGDVIAEGLYVMDEPFGESKYQYGHPFAKMDEKARATAYDDNEDTLRRNPFHMAWAVFRWDKAHVADYHRIRKGHPEVIASKENSYSQAIKSAQHSIALLDTVKEQLPEGAYPFFRFKLEENLWQLRFYCELQLAWLRLSGVLHNLAANSAQVEIEKARLHLENARSAARETATESVMCSWNGRVYQCKRGQYVDIKTFFRRMNDFWEPLLASSTQ